MKRTMLAGMLALLVLLAGCSGEEQAPQLEPVWVSERISSVDALLERVNGQHRAVEKPAVDFEQYIQGFSQNPFAMSTYMEQRDFDPELPVTQQQAQADLDILLRILEGNYGMYYFWGEELFWQAEKQLLEQLGRYEEGLTAGQWAELLLQEFSFVQDAHFRINEQPMHRPVNGYVYDSVPFERSGDCFRSMITMQVVEQVGEETALNAVFRLSLDGEGELVYYPVILSADEPQPLAVAYENGEVQYLPAPVYSSWYEGGDRQVSLHYNRGYPVLFARNMGFDQQREDVMEGQRFLEYARLLRQEPVVIVDLRSNTGGNLLLPMKWLAEFAGQVVPTNYVTVNYTTEEALREYGTNEDNLAFVPYDELKEIGGWETVSERYMKSNGHPDRFVENDRLLVLLVGKHTGSAAEAMVDMAYNLENTLIVGENTYGALSGNAYAWIFLPHSGVKIQFGSTLSVFPQDHFEEFQGFLPDLWATGNAEEQVVAMLEKMKIH